MPSSTLSHVHETIEGVAEVEMSPPHAPREDTPEYRHAHHKLIVEQDSPCAVCGVRHSTLGDLAQNPFHAKALESHHWPIERSLITACDWRKLAGHFPSIHSQADLAAWVDSTENLLVLCDIHHRSVESGIHHLLTQDWAVMPYLLDGYKIAATKADATSVERADEALIEQHSS